jgi:hypothetical protein
LSCSLPPLGSHHPSPVLATYCLHSPFPLLQFALASMSAPHSTLPIPPSYSLRGKACIVSGGSRGIGRGLAMHLASLGASFLCVTYRSAASASLAASVVAEIQSLPHRPKACAVQADIESSDCGEKIVNAALAGLGVESIDVLINNAGRAPTAEEIAGPDGGLDGMWKCHIRVQSCYSTHCCRTLPVTEEESSTCNSHTTTLGCWCRR